MSICTKCGIDKPIDQYQTYWHSTQQTTRTRRYCNSCLREQRKKWKESIKMDNKTQPVVPELQPEPIIDYSTNPDYKKCRYCLEWKHKDEYYQKNNKIIFGSCKECECKRAKEKRDKEVMEKGGSYFVFSEPNKYADDLQRQGTFKIMKVLGYLFDEETGIWTKPGWKEIRDGQPHFPNVTFKKGKKRLTKEDKENIKRLYEKGYSVDDISIEMKLSDTTVYRYVKE